MNRLYPRTKWSDTATSEHQLVHVMSEVKEVKEQIPEEDIDIIFTPIGSCLKINQNRLDEEVADLEHSIQTYWDCREREGADVESIRQAVIEKNRRRGYYEGGD